MSEPANLDLCRQLWELTGWTKTDYTWRHHIPQKASTLLLTAEKEADEQRYRHQPREIAERFAKENAFYPAYDLSYLVGMAFELGLTHVKIKQAEGGVIVTAPPCYHVEGSTPANTLAKLLIRAVKKQKAAA